MIVVSALALIVNVIVLGYIIYQAKILAMCRLLVFSAIVSI